ncbi:MAG TPA: peptide deformylase [Candidatus Pacebacteria bacterium]|nr:peptide deformylase [Candidatus Paceibacterota bacterium]
MSTLPIIIVPHPTLRLPAKPVMAVTPELQRLVVELAATLDSKRRPSGVGLAAPQVNQLWRIFSLKLDLQNPRRGSGKVTLTTMINPIITKHSLERSLGPDSKNPALEGCLSMPGLYGPVPRWEWIDLEFSELQNGQLISQKLHLVDFPARVAQHEADHLEGILFTDYANEYDLPVYQEDKKGDLIEIEDRSLLAYL